MALEETELAAEAGGLTLGGGLVVAGLAAAAYYGIGRVVRGIEGKSN